MRYLVTGGAGFIGSALVKRLAADGHGVTVLDDASRGRWDRLDGISCERVAADVRDEAAVIRAMHGCDTVIHLAYVNGTATFYSEPRQVLDVALRGMLNILVACEATGCRDLMLVSSSEAYQVATTVPTPETVPCSIPDPLNPRYSYGGGKAACEIMANAWQRAGVLDRAIIVRPHNIYSADMGNDHVIPEFCRRMNQLTFEQPEGVIPFSIQGTGLETRSFCHADDCIDQIVFLLENADSLGIWHVGNMDERTVSGVAEDIAACYGRSVKVVPGTLQKGSPPRRLPDLAKIMALGYAGPKISFAEGLPGTVEWYRAHAA